MNAEESELLRATEWNRAEQQKRALKAELLISRIQSALATAEEGEALLAVAECAHEAELDISHLERLLRNCRHAKLQYNDDSDAEDEHGMLPLGFSIRMDGCAGLWSVAGPTLHDAIVADMAESERDLRRMGGTAEPQETP